MKLPWLSAWGLLLIAGWWPVSVCGEEEPARRWVYLQLNFQVDENVNVAEGLMRRAAAAGYNGIVLADYKFNILDRVPDRYFHNLAQVKTAARQLNLELIPAVAGIGYSEGLLAHDPNLAEGLPCKDVPLRVERGAARLQSELADALPGGSFETYRGHQMAGWDFQDFPGQASFVDQAVRHGGGSSLRFENLGQVDSRHGNGRVSRRVTVRPWRQYHAAVWIKTEMFEAAANVRMFAMSTDGRVLSYSHLKVKPNQDWTEHHVVFNSLGYDQVRLYIGVWGGKGGRLWLDDARLEETAFVNLLRRPGCPLVITGADGQTYVEGKDFSELADKRMGRVPYAGNFEVYHEPPVLEIPPTSRIREGQRLRAGFYHTVTIYDGQVTCCLAAPGVFRVLQDQIARVEKLLEPRTYFLSHDEIRLANWCEACNRPERSAGQLLAENVQRVAAIVKQINPRATICVWSDMFDPHHNAKKDYYLVNGDLAGSWAGLERNMVIVNWNHGQADQSLRWFSERGHAQVLAGYYDGNPASIADWLRQAAGLAGVNGVMYTTWQHRFADLEAFSRHAWQAGKRR